MGHINNFCVKEITNAHYAATLYHEIMQSTPSVNTPATITTDTKKEEEVTPATDGEKKEEATDE